MEHPCQRSPSPCETIQATTEPRSHLQFARFPQHGEVASLCHSSTNAYLGLQALKVPFCELGPLSEQNSHDRLSAMRTKDKKDANKHQGVIQVTKKVTVATPLQKPQQIQNDQHADSKKPKPLRFSYSAINVYDQQ